MRVPELRSNANLLQRAARSDFARSGLLVFFAVSAASALYYGYYLVVGHVVSVAAYGTVMSLVSLSMLATTPAAIGQTIVATMVAQRAAGRGVLPPSITALTATVSLGAMLAIVTVGYVFAGQIARFLQIDRLEYVVLTALATALCVPLFLGRGLLQGAQLFRAFAASNLLDGVLRFGLAVALTPRFEVSGALGAMVVGLAVSAGYGVAVAGRHAGRTSAASLALPSMKTTIVWTGAISFALIALGYYDPILVKHYLPPVDAGVYGLLSLAGRTVAIVLSFVPIVLLPKVAERTMHGLSSRDILGAALGVCATVGACATAGCALAGPFVIRVLAGKSFSAAAPLLAMYVAAASLLALANVLAAFLIAKRDFRVVVPLSIAAIGEVTVVALRHPTLLAVVQDVLAGHAAVAAVVLIALVVRGLEQSFRSGAKLAA